MQMEKQLSVSDSVLQGSNFYFANNLFVKWLFWPLLLLLFLTVKPVKSKGSSRFATSIDLVYFPSF